MPPVQWKRDLAALLARYPYKGHGGIKLLAEDLGVSYPTLKSWRNGHRTPNAANRVLLAEARERGES